MKFQISKSVLTKSLSYNQSIVEKRTTLPILSHILLEAKENSLTITSTNMDMSFIQKIDCVVEEEGKICIPSQLFFDIARKLGEGIISFQLDPKTLFLHIHAKRSQFKLPGMKGEEFPSITLTPLTHEFFIQGNELSYLIDQSRFAICDEETRFVLNGVYFHVVEENATSSLRAVATDTHRLACISLSPAPDHSTNMPTAIVSKKTLTEIRRIIDEHNGSITVGLSPARIQLCVKANGYDGVFSSRLIDANYPDYQAIFDLGFNQEAIVSTKDFLQSIDRISTILSPNDQSIKLSITQNTIYIKASNHVFGSANEEIDTSSSVNEPVDINFNATYLLQLLRQIRTLETKISFISSDQAVLFTPHGITSDATNEQYILMPLIDDSAI